MPPTPRPMPHAPRHARTVALAAPLALAAALALLAAAPPAPSHAGATNRPSPLARPTPTRVPGSCDAFARRTISPDTVIVGEPATVTLSLRLDCAPTVPFPVHVVLAVDDTDAIATPAGRDALRVLRGWVMGLPTHPKDSTLRVGVVGFRAPRPKVRCLLSTRLEMARRCIDRLKGSGEGSVADGIAAAYGVLKAGRPAGTDMDAGREVIVVVRGDGDTGRHADPTCRLSKQAAGAVKGQGILLVVVALGDGVERRCWSDVATSPRYFLTLTGQPPALPRIAEIVDIISERNIDSHRDIYRLDVFEMLPVNATFVADRFAPTPNELDVRYAHWNMTYFPRNGMTFTYQIRVATPGLLDVPSESVIAASDYRQRRTPFDVPPARLRVVSGFIDPWP